MMLIDRLKALAVYNVAVLLAMFVYNKLFVCCMPYISVPYDFLLEYVGYLLIIVLASYYLLLHVVGKKYNWLDQLKQFLSIVLVYGLFITGTFFMIMVWGKNTAAYHPLWLDFSAGTLWYVLTALLFFVPLYAVDHNVFAWNALYEIARACKKHLELLWIIPLCALAGYASMIIGMTYIIGYPVVKLVLLSVLLLGYLVMYQDTKLKA